MSESVSKDKQPHNPNYAEDEEWEEQLQQRINQLCEKPGQHISKRTLRWLIITYGKSTVTTAARRVEKRDYVDENPPGFLIAILRSDNKRGKVRELMREMG